MGSFEREGALPPVPLILGLLLALALSVGLVWLLAESSITAAAFGGSLLVLSLAAMIYARVKPEVEEVAHALPDWSVTLAAIEKGGDGVVIIDRANRMVCANERFLKWFGQSAIPPELPVDQQSREGLVEAARKAWREGEAEVGLLLSPNEDKRWSARLQRAGRADDYLVWHFSEIVNTRIEDLISENLTGLFGVVLSRAGLEAALVRADGRIESATPGLGERASGNARMNIVHAEFVQMLRTDERNRIFYAHEGMQGSPQTLVNIALDPPGTTSTSNADQASSLMLLIDSTVVLGGGSESAGRNAVPQLEALLSALPLGLALTDRDGRFLFANKAFMRAVDRRDKGLPQYPSDLVVREDKGAFADSVRRFAKGPIASGNMPVRLSSDPEEPISIGFAGVRGLGDAAVLLSMSDSSEEKRLRRQVAQATKMQAVGQLAGGVAHDFNNVLTAIIGYCDLMLLRHSPGDSDYDDIQQIRANSNRAASLTRQLLAFSRQQTLQPVVLQLPDVVSEVSQLLKRLMSDGIEFTVRHDRELGPVRADPQQLEQVIVNLAVNARDAILASGTTNGRLTMATRRVSREDVERMDIEVMPVDDYTALIIQDTGGGIPAHILPKIFEPFFTTKEQGKGTGLGLSTVYGIVKQSNGYIFADNIPASSGRQAGARFTVYLPVYKGDALPAPSGPPLSEEPDADASDWSTGGNLLLVEDEDMVRAVAERALSRAGYQVTTASDGEEGLAQIANGGGFDLVVSDVVMPGMDGPTMAKAIRKVHPDLPILFMSGYAEEQLRRDINIENMYFIAKPFSVQQIGAKVSEVLGQKGK
ncbi:response regulator [Altererythrobacter aurantiacus]|uniref:histidine kinase n=1 Tax=Parapontixanthobacter aurantiacus TaxID=1463599 RepID=A0A844ZE57_9SPHN|nr:PAS domain-containing sensor histidine kinase [Parapontixanthobacter aurantiacus]MXO85543.1 response regulator [Parapontixanthobacter aurantiacus]